MTLKHFSARGVRALRSILKNTRAIPRDPATRWRLLLRHLRPATLICRWQTFAINGI
jgi:hypothetical protein